MAGACRNHALVRMAKLLQVCLTRRVLPPLSELAAELGCHPRTVRRTLEAMQEAHLPVPMFRAPEPGEMRKRREGRAA